MRDSIPGQVDRKSRVPEEEGGWSGALEEAIGIWNSQRGRKDKDLFFSIFLSFSHLKLFFFFLL